MDRQDGLCQEIKRLLDGQPESAGVRQALYTLAAAIAGLRADHLALAEACHGMLGRLGILEARVAKLEAQRLEPCQRS